MAVTLLPRHRLTAALTIATALSAAGVAEAAAPVLQSKTAAPLNPRTSTPVRFFAHGTDPDGTKIQYAWDFGGGFGTLSDSSTQDHTFSSDGIHQVSVRVQDAAGESAGARFPLATHAENWNPSAFLDTPIRVIGRNLRTLATPQEIRGPDWYDDSPSSAATRSWDVNGDGTYNGAGDGEPGHLSTDRRVTFAADGDHPVKVKISDGQGGETIFAWTVRTHTANEGPYLYETQASNYDRAFVFTRADLSGGGGYLDTTWLDDYTHQQTGLSWTWKLDGATVSGEVDDRLTIPANIAAGEHTAEVTATDAGHNPGDSAQNPGGPARSTTETIKFVVVESRPARIVTESRVDLAPDPSTFRPLENALLYAVAPSSQTAVSAEWDLDADGEFDDSSGLTTSFAAAAPGTYPVAARLQVQGGGVMTVNRDIVIAPPAAGDPGSSPAPPTPSTVGGGQIVPPAIPPAAEAMRTFLGAAAGRLLQRIGALNKNGLELKKPGLILGELGPEQLPNGGTGQFGVYDKPGGAKLARAAAAKRKKLGSTKVTLAKGQKKKVTVKLNAKGKSLLKKKRKVKLTVDATLTDALTGATVTRSKTYTFKVKKAKKKS